MITQDALRFYKSHSVYPQFGGIVLDREEGKQIAKYLGEGKACILQNHGLLTVGSSVDEAAFWFISLDKTCHAQLLVDAASAGSGHPKKFIAEEEAAYTYKSVGSMYILVLHSFLLTLDLASEKGWLAFQGYYDEQLAKSNGSFLK